MIQDGVTVIEKNYGLANVELSVPVTFDTVYEIASMTKGFTAAAISLRVAEGKLSLGELLARFRPALPDAWQTVTVRRLLTHTSGIPQWEVAWDREDLTIEEIDQGAFGRPLRFAPDTEFEYVDTYYTADGHRLSFF